MKQAVRMRITAHPRRPAQAAPRRASNSCCSSPRAACPATCAARSRATCATGAGSNAGPGPGCRAPGRPGLDRGGRAPGGEQHRHRHAVRGGLNYTAPEDGAPPARHRLPRHRGRPARRRPRRPSRSAAASRVVRGRGRDREPDPGRRARGSARPAPRPSASRCGPSSRPGATSPAARSPSPLPGSITETRDGAAVSALCFPITPWSAAQGAGADD